MRPLHRALSSLLVAASCLAAAALPLASTASAAEDYQLIEGTGSTWSQNAINQWIADVSSVGMQVAYGGGGSSKGRRDFGEGTVDFAVSEIPYQGRDPRTGQSDSANGRDFAYMPIVAGGTAFMYHLEIGGELYRGLRLSGKTITNIFTGRITNWSDPQITRDNNGFKLPPTKIVPVVRSDGSGTTAQLTTWMDEEYSSLWRPFCDCRGLTSYYPIKNGFVAKDGSVGVSQHVSSSYGNGTIGYVEYSYALNKDYPVAKMLNKAGYYVEPTAYNVAVALTKARINRNRGSNLYLTQILDGVYRNPDRRTYPLSSYSYMVVPTSRSDPRMNEAKGRTLGDFGYYFLCEGQQQAPALGYSPLPLNLVQAGFRQIKRIPWSDTAAKGPKQCNNPTFDPDNPNSNLLAETAPLPPRCDKRGQGPCGVVVTPTGAGGGGPAAGPGAGPGATPGTTPGGAGTVGGGTGGPTDPATTAGAGGGGPTAGGAGSADLDGDGVPDAVDPAAVPGASDPATTGELFATSTQVSPYRDAGSSAWLVGLVAVQLLALAVAPPLVARALRPRDAPR